MRQAVRRVLTPAKAPSYFPARPSPATQERRLVCVWQTAVEIRTLESGRYVDQPVRKGGSAAYHLTSEAPDINDSGKVAFVGSFPGSPGGDDFVLRTTADIPDRVAAGGVPDGCNGPESVEGPLAMNAGGQVACVARLDSGARTVFLGGSQIVSGATDILDEFTNVALSDAGTVVYLRETINDTSVAEGIYLGSGAKVIATGDALFGSTVTDLGFDRDGLNNAGQIAFNASLQDGREVIVRVDP